MLFLFFENSLIIPIRQNLDIEEVKAKPDEIYSILPGFAEVFLRSINALCWIS
jgi:hypothetical protein